MSVQLVTTKSVADDLKAWLEGIFAGHTYKAPPKEYSYNDDGNLVLEDAENRRAMTIYLQSSPHPKHDDVGTELESVPYIIVHIGEGQITDYSGEQTASVILLFCIYDADPAVTGSADIWSIKEKITTEIMRHPYVGSAEITLPLEWTTDDGGMFPFFFGSLSFAIKIRSIQTQESDLA